jgi:hypothetical protein
MIVPGVYLYFIKSELNNTLHKLYPVVLTKVETIDELYQAKSLLIRELSSEIVSSQILFVNSHFNLLHYLNFCYLIFPL